MGGSALVAFAIAVVAFGGDVTGGGPGDTATVAAVGSCGKGKPDPAYNVTWSFDVDPPAPGYATIHLTVRHRGRPVPGAKVCVVADMPDMSHSGTDSAAVEMPDGRYDAELNFSMGGSWAATVTIAEAGAAVVTVPLAFKVAAA